MKTLIAAALLFALTTSGHAYPLSLKICLDGWDGLSAQELKRALKEDKEGLPRSIHCKIAKSALKKHQLRSSTDNSR